MKGSYYAGDNVAEKTVIPNVGNYKPEIHNQHLDVPAPPLEQAEEKLLKDE